MTLESFIETLMSNPEDKKFIREHVSRIGIPAFLNNKKIRSYLRVRLEETIKDEGLREGIWKGLYHGKVSTPDFIRIVFNHLALNMDDTFANLRRARMPDFDFDFDSDSFRLALPANLGIKVVTTRIDPHQQINDSLLRRIQLSDTTRNPFAALFDMNPQITAQITATPLELTAPRVTSHVEHAIEAPDADADADADTTQPAFR